MLIDAVFSFDSVITAGGTAKHVEITDRGGGSGHDRDVSFQVISSFVHKHPTIKMPLALSFLVMIGLSLVIGGWDHETSEKLGLKNYIYFGMAFSFCVEMLNMAMRRKMNKRVVKLE